jgi:hypothetical protein
MDGQQNIKGIDVLKPRLRWYRETRLIMGIIEIKVKINDWQKAVNLDRNIACITVTRD